MPYNRDQLRQLAITIRDEYRQGANTAHRVGSALLAMIDANPEIAELAKLFLRRDQQDLTKFLIKFLGGIEVGEAVDSMTAGRGTIITDHGRVQADRLEVRGSAVFMEVLINRLQAQASDFVFTESATIEAIEELADGMLLITLRKNHDYDFHAFHAQDVIYGSVNTLLADGSYRTSWLKPVTVDTAANTIVAALYPDDEVPGGKNYPPTVGMVLNRRGNAIDEERQSCWYISARERVIMYLEGVTKPILDESNYYLSLGRPKNLELFAGLPINYKHPYLFARGAVVQDLLRVDFQGNPIYEIVDVGNWNDKAQYICGLDGSRYIQHQCWHNSCCWRCVAEKAEVGVAPRYNSTQWICVANDNYTVTITSTKGKFFRPNNEYTQLGFILKHGDDDITNVEAWQVKWTRESNLPAEDQLWNTEHADNVLTVDIAPLDMPSNWLEVRQVFFRVTIYVKDGEKPLTQTFTINR